MNRVNALSIDVEDYFQVSNFSKVIRFSDWDKYQCRVERNTLYVLNVLNDFNVKATFFVLGWIAERYPQLIKNIHQEGHEIASHGYCHQLISSQTREEFREDTRKTKRILEDITGVDVIGYRAPAYSITQKSFWTFEVLIKEGFKYDSSILPIRSYHYGIPDTPRFPFVINGNPTNPMNSVNSINSSDGFIIEFPISTVRLFANNLPIAGGGYFRLFPYQFTKWGLKKINQEENKPFIFYLHPWEFDPDQPRIKKASTLSKFRHYVNLEKTEPKLKRLLKDFNFSTVREVLGLT